MTFEQLFRKLQTLSISPLKRRESHILLVDSEKETRIALKRSLISLGYQHISEAPDNAVGLSKMVDRPVTHVIFDARINTLNAKEFLNKALSLDNNLVIIPSSFNPSLDDVFDLLIGGARGFLVKPFTEYSLDQSVTMATCSEPVSEAVLHAKNRNQALAALVISALDRLSTIMRQANQFETAKREVSVRMLGLKQAIELARTFTQGGNDALLESLIELFVERGSQPASKLGRFRKRLSTKMNAREGLALVETAPSISLGSLTSEK